MNDQFHIRPARAADIPAVVALHIQAFQGFFLTLMGPRFLTVLYRGFLLHKSGLFLVVAKADQVDQVLGFVAGTTRPAGYFKDQLRTHWLSYGLAALRPLLFNPGLVIQKLWSALFYRGETLPELPNAALLSSLGVSPQQQGHGLGIMLVDAFVAECKRQGLPAVYLTTDQSNNEKANAFYNRCGFHLAGICKRPPNRILNRYLIEL